MTKITEQLMECRTGGELDEFLYLDPKLLKGGDVVPKNRAPFQDAVVFMVGGGNYIEYQNLVDFTKVGDGHFVYKMQVCLYCVKTVPAKTIGKYDEAHHLRRVDAKQCQAVSAPTYAVGTGDQGDLKLSSAPWYIPLKCLLYVIISFITESVFVAFFMYC